MSAVATTPLPTASTTIAAIHARYEAAWIADAALDAEENLRDDHASKFRIDEARKRLCHETDALRLAILYQVPSSWGDALILQFHISGMADLLSAFDGRPEGDDRALVIGIDSLFNFLAQEIAGVDHEGVGPSFKAATMLAWRRGVLRDANFTEAA